MRNSILIFAEPDPAAGSAKIKSEVCKARQCLALHILRSLGILGIHKNHLTYLSSAHVWSLTMCWAPLTSIFSKRSWFDELDKVNRLCKYSERRQWQLCIHKNWLNSAFTIYTKGHICSSREMCQICALIGGARAGSASLRKSRENQILRKLSW